jgi:hypothetical protein
MDELHNSFGRLSTQAPEWKPQSLMHQQQQQHVIESDLNPGKEYIPGRGWNSVMTAATGEENPCYHFMILHLN